MDNNQQNLQTLLQEKKTEEMVQLARATYEKENSSTSRYNLAVSLERNGQLEEAATILQEMHEKLKNKDTIHKTGESSTKLADMEMKILEKMFESEKVEQLLDLQKNVTEENIRLFLLKLYFRLGKDEEMKGLVRETATVDQITKILSLGDILYYYLDIYGHEIQLQLIIGRQEIKVWNSSLDVSLLPPSLQIPLLNETEVFKRGGIQLPDLKELTLIGMNSCVSLLQTVPFTSLAFNGVEEVDVDLIPPTVKTITLELEANNTRVIGGVRKVIKLYPYVCMEDFLTHLHPKVLVIPDFHEYDPKDMIPLMNKEIEAVLVMQVEWGEQSFNDSILSQYLDKQDPFYLLQGGRGKAADGEEMAKVLEKYRY